MGSIRGLRMNKAFKGDAVPCPSTYIQHYFLKAVSASCAIGNLPWFLAIYFPPSRARLIRSALQLHPNPKGGLGDQGNLPIEIIL